MSPYATDVTFVMLDAPVTRGVELTQVDLTRRLIRQEVELEIPSVALLVQTLAHRERPLSRELPLAVRQHVGENVVAAPTAVVGRELRESRELRHQRADQRAVSRDDCFDRTLERIDAPHRLDVLTDDLLLVRLPISFVGDEECRLSRVAVRRLHDQIVTESTAASELHERRIVVRATHRVRHARHARFVPELRGDDLRVEPVAQRRRWEHHFESELGGELLGLLVEHQERSLAPRPAAAHVIDDLLVTQEVVADLFDGRELASAPLLGHEHVRMEPVERVVIVDESEVAHPPIDAEQVERRGRDEVDRLLVRAEEASDLGDPAERSLPQRGLLRTATRTVHQVSRSAGPLTAECNDVIFIA